MEMLKKGLVHMANMVASFDFINIDPQHHLLAASILVIDAVAESFRRYILINSIQIHEQFTQK